MAKAKPEFLYEDFLALVDPGVLPFVEEMHKELISRGCTLKIAEAKSGYVVSYGLGEPSRVLLNYVFRKKGLMVRVYTDHILEYMQYLEELPPAMVKGIAKAPVCRRLVNPTLCNASCPKGYEFLLEGQPYQKCRYNCFLLLTGEESNPYIQGLVQRELQARSA